MSRKRNLLEAKMVFSFGKKRLLTRTILGKIITENRNIFTTVPHPGYGASTIGHLFGKPDKYMPDPYEGRKEIERVERIIFYLFIKVVE